jgi:hypothetical protein
MDWMVILLPEKKSKRISVTSASLSERGWKSFEYRALHVLGMSSRAVPPSIDPCPGNPCSSFMYVR